MSNITPFVPKNKAGKKARSTKAPQRPNGDNKPLIRVLVGDLARMVDETEAAIVKADLAVYQRNNMIVSTGTVPVITADKQEVASQQIVPIGDHALMERCMLAANYEKWDARADEFVPCNIPPMIVKTLEQRTGRFRLPVLAGIVNAPTLRADGSILSEPGYDALTGLLFDPGDEVFPTIRNDPTKAHAKAALAALEELIADFPFETDADRSVALSGILTAVVRRSLRTAPLHAYTAPTAGSGKTKLVDIASVIATGRETGVIAMGNPEELEKRLVALLLGGYSVAIDNVNGNLYSDLLCQMLTQTLVRPRILGKSEAPEMSTNVMVTATGNNLVLVGDMTRRSIRCRLDAQVERPELREFAFEPVSRAKSERGRYIAATITLLRAFHLAGRPSKTKPLGSFEDWSTLIRDSLIWLGRADPVETMEKSRALDPKTERLKSVIAHWSTIIGAEAVTAADATHRASERETHNPYDPGVKPGFAHPEFRDALMSVAGAGGFIDPQKLARWLSQNRNAVAHGVFFEGEQNRNSTMVWRLSPVPYS